MKKILGWVISVLAAVGALLAFVFGRGKGNIPMVEKELEEAEKTTTAAEKRQESRKERAKKLSDRLNKLPPLILVLMLVFTVQVQAADLTYDELLKSYKEAVEIAHEYKALYEEAEADLDLMIEQNKRLQTLVKEQQEMIKSLLRSKLSVSAGVTYDLQGPGVVALATYTF